MGLDSFWADPDKVARADELRAQGRHEEANQVPTDIDVTFDPPLALTGGMLSGTGQGSFRGKVYDPVIEYVTGESLYQEEIPPETVRRMADALEATPYDNVWEVEEDIQATDPYTFPLPSEEEYEDLARMFRAYGDAGACLVGWW